jgi:phosphoadenosine phosphosulfate reductase
MVARLNAQFVTAASQDVLAFVLKAAEAWRVAVVSSFGTESAVLLHMVSLIAPQTEILFIDTGKHFPETLEYRAKLAERLRLQNFRDIRPCKELLAEKDAKGMRWSYDPDFCCEVRKVRPLLKALEDFDATITGRKAFQAETRDGLSIFELDETRLKINPLASWKKPQIDAYFVEHNLPRHPLESQGYLSVGCAPCTSKVLPGENIRAGRWRDLDKTECGIHLAANAQNGDD